MRNKEDNACKSWYRMGCCLVTKSCPTLATSWVVAHQAPCPWDFPGKNTGLGSHSVLQGIFPNHGSNLGLLHCRQILYHLSHHRYLINNIGI